MTEDDLRQMTKIMNELGKRSGDRLLCCS